MAVKITFGRLGRHNKPKTTRRWRQIGSYWADRKGTYAKAVAEARYNARKFGVPTKVVKTKDIDGYYSWTVWILTTSKHADIMFAHAIRREYG